MAVTYSLTSNPGGLFSIVSNELRVASSLKPGRYPLSILATSTDGWVANKDVTITVTGSDVPKYYIDPAGSDSNDGLSPATAWASIAKLNQSGLLQDGDVIALKRGSTFSGTIDPPSPYRANLKFIAYDSGANPKIDNNNTDNAHGIVVRGADWVIRDIDFYRCHNGVYAYGTGASMWIYGGTFDGNGTAIAADEDGHMKMINGVVCQNSWYGTARAGDGIQISQFAHPGTHNIVNVRCTGNGKAGVNHKVGTLNLVGSTMSFNSEPGVISQNDAVLMNIRQCVLEGNNAANAGTFNMSIENTTEVRSERNLYLNPTTGSGSTINVFLQNGACKFYSKSDVFVRTSTTGLFRGHIATSNITAAFVIDVRNASFYMAMGSGAAIDMYNDVGSGASLTVKNCAFHMTAHKAVRVPDVVPLDLANNCWYRADGNEFFEIQDARYYFTEADLRTGEGAGADPGSFVGNPLFTAPTAAVPNMALGSGSPCLGAGSASHGVTINYFGASFTSPPNIGAV